MQPINKLESTRGEAGTRGLLHAAHAARSKFASVVTVPENTDVLILLLAFNSFLFLLQYYLNVFHTPESSTRISQELL